jgi:hypothetical protein
MARRHGMHIAASAASHGVDLIDAFRDEEHVREAEKKANGVKALKQGEALREIFFNEVIMMHILDADSNPRHGCTFQILRRQCILPFVQSLADRSPAGQEDGGFEVDCVRQIETNLVILPSSMQNDCKTLPNSYSIIQRPKTKVKDCAVRSKYSGEYKFLVHNVPVFSESGKFRVKSSHIKDWIVCGVVHMEKPIRKINHVISLLDEKLHSLTNAMQLVKKRTFFDESGRELFGTDADSKREKMYVTLAVEKETAELQKLHTLKNLECERSRLSKKVDISVSEGGKAGERMEWVFKFHGLHKCHYESLVLKNREWTKMHIVLHGNPSKMLCAFDMKTVSSILELYEIEDGAVDLAGISMERVEHGIGSFFEFFKSDTLENEHNRPILFYKGDFTAGKASGEGFIGTDAGFFSGQVEDMQPLVGTMTFANGGQLVGRYQSRKIKYPSAGVNPYNRPCPCGKVVETFADGAVYEGEMLNGHITGYGKYVNALGEAYDGHFLRGQYHGIGTLTNALGEICEGTFHFGHLHGQAKVTNSQMTFTGNFDLGQRNGRGLEEYHSGEKFVGWFQNDQKWGHGREICESSGKLIEGTWRANKFMAGLQQDGSTKDKDIIRHLGFDGKMQVFNKMKRILNQQRARLSQYHYTDIKLRKGLIHANISIYCRVLVNAKIAILNSGNQQEDKNSGDGQMKKKQLRYFDKRKGLLRPKSVAEASTDPGVKAVLVELSKHVSGRGLQEVDQIEGKNSDDPVEIILINMFHEIGNEWLIEDVEKIMKNIESPTDDVSISE